MRSITPTTTKSYAYYDVVKDNWHGPITAIGQLPTTSQWKNVSLSSTIRAIKNEAGGTTSNNGVYTLPQKFSYEGYAARFLTTQELEKACDITVKYAKTGELDMCRYLMEGTKYSNNNYSDGYWLENPMEANMGSVWLVYGSLRNASNIASHATNGYGVRPAIEVPISRISSQS